METKDLIAKSQVTIHAPVDKVWDALVKPEIIKKYMFGADIVSDWKEGSKIYWKGEYEGRPYEDRGIILQFKPKTKLEYTHYSPMTGLPDVPENYHKITIDLAQRDEQTVVALSQDNNANEEAREHSEKNWGMMLDSLKKLLEKGEFN